MRALEDAAVKEQETIKKEVEGLRGSLEAGTQLKSEERDGEEEVDGDDDDARSVYAVIPHEVENVEKKEEQMVKVEREQSLDSQQEPQEQDQDQDQDQKEHWDEHDHQHQRLLQDDEEDDEREREGDMERRKRHVQLVWGPHAPEPIGLGMTHLSDDEDDDPYHHQHHHQHQHNHQHHLRPQRASTSPPPHPHALVIDELLRSLTALTTQLESSNLLQTRHAGALRTIEVLREQVVEVEVLITARSSLPAELTPTSAGLDESELAVIPTKPAEPAAAPPPAPNITTGLADADALRLGKVCGRPVVLQAGGMGCKSRLIPFFYTHFFGHYILSQTFVLAVS